MHQGQVVEGIIFEHNDFGHQPATAMDALEQVVTQQGVIGHPLVQAAGESIHIVDALAYIIPFAKQILVNVGYGRGVQVQNRISRVDPRKNGAVCRGKLDLHPGLEHGVAVVDRARHGVNVGMVQRVRKRSDQVTGALARQDGVGIQRDHIADGGQDLQIPKLNHITCFSNTPQQVIQFHKLATFALPPHPAAFAGIPQTLAVEKEKWAVIFVPVFRIKLFDPLPGLGDDLIFTWQLSLLRILKIGQQGKVKVWIGIGQVQLFQLIQQRLKISLVFEHGGDHNQGAELLGNAVTKVESWQHARRDDSDRQPVDQVHRHGRGRDQGEEGAKHNGYRLQDAASRRAGIGCRAGAEQSRQPTDSPQVCG